MSESQKELISQITDKTTHQCFEEIPVEQRQQIIKWLKHEIIKKASFVQLTELEVKGIQLSPEIYDVIKNQEMFIGNRQNDDLGRQDITYTSIWILPVTQAVYRDRSYDDCVFRRERCEFKCVIQIRTSSHKLFDVPIERPIVSTTLIGLNTESSIELDLMIRNFNK